MRPGLWRTPLWAGCSGLLLLAGFAALLFVVGRLVSGDPETVERTRQGLAVYAGVVLLKGLLPAWLLTFVGYRAVAGRFGFEGSRARMAVGLAVCGLVTSLVVAAVLFPLELPGLPSVVFQGPGNFVATVLELTAAVALAWWLPRLLVPALR